MAERNAAVEAYLAALGAADDGAGRALEGAFADDVIVETNFGRAQGREAAIALLREPRTAGLVATGARWSPPAADTDTDGNTDGNGNGNRIVVTATLPETAPFGGLELVFEFRGDTIIRVRQQTMPPPPLPPRPLRLTPEIKIAVDGALDNQTPMLIAYVDSADQVHLSFRGTIQAYCDDQLALWAREPDGGLPQNIAAHPKVTLFYHDAASRTSYSFYGRARVATDPAARGVIFENSHPREQQADYRRRGVAIIVDLDRVEGREAGGRLLLQRDQ
ncbi:MAG: pyridoxamine 5'-phosphate oxidase family protein, partial [Streptosporangiaceae bacterium]